MTRIGLIGFGRFGQLLFRHLKNRADIQVCDPQQEQQKFSDAPRFQTLKDTCQNPLVIIATPVSAIDRVCREMAGFLAPDSVVMDVCAVKQYPVQVMEKIFPKNVHILGTHPLFGPDSAHSSLSGHLMIMTPHRISPEKLEEVKTFWTGVGILIHQMTPEEQDRLMAWTLALTHFLGRGLNNLPLPETTIATRDYQNLIQLMTKINRDTREMFQDMHCYNPFTHEMRQMLLQSMNNLKNQLDNLTPGSRNPSI